MSEKPTVNTWRELGKKLALFGIVAIGLLFYGAILFNHLSKELKSEKTQENARAPRLVERETWTAPGEYSRPIVRSEEEIVTVSGPSDLVAELTLVHPLTQEEYPKTVRYPDEIQLPPNWKKVKFRSETVWLKIVTRAPKAQ